MPIRIAIIGCGGMANGHLNAYRTIHNTVPDKVELVAMCDEIKDRAVNYEDVVSGTIEVYQKPINERWGL